MKTAVAFFTLIAVLAGLSWYITSQRDAPRQEGNYQVYQSGEALELALDLDSIANVNDGLVRFINQERYAEKKREESLDISYQVRRLEGRADCRNMQYAFINTSYWTARGKHVYTQMFPLQRYNWAFVPVEPASIAETMLKIVCRLAPSAPSEKIE